MKWGGYGRMVFVKLSEGGAPEQSGTEPHTAGVAYEHANVGLHMLRDYRNKPSVGDSLVSGMGS